MEVKDKSLKKNSFLKKKIKSLDVIEVKEEMEQREKFSSWRTFIQKQSIREQNIQLLIVNKVTSFQF